MAQSMVNFRMDEELKSEMEETCKKWGWQTQDRKALKKINRLLNDIDRNGYQCTVEIVQCESHYRDK